MKTMHSRLLRLSLMSWVALSAICSHLATVSASVRDRRDARDARHEKAAAMVEHLSSTLTTTTGSVLGHRKISMDVADGVQASILSDDPIATRDNPIVFTDNQHQHRHGNMRGLQTTGTPSNDQCRNAISLRTQTTPLTVQGSTASATREHQDVVCFGMSANAPGVWYTVEGHGGMATASLCGGGTNYDSKLHVMVTSDGNRHLGSGSCSLDTFRCIVRNDDSCGTRSSVTWPTMSDVTYYVLVSGYNGNTGSFSMEVSREGGDMFDDRFCDDPAALYDLVGYHSDDLDCVCFADSRAISCFPVTNSECTGEELSSCSCDGPNCFENQEIFFFEDATGSSVTSASVNEKTTCRKCFSNDSCLGFRETCLSVIFDAGSGDVVRCSLREFYDDDTFSDWCYSCSPCTDEDGNQGLMYNCFDRDTGGQCDTTSGKYAVHPLLGDTRAAQQQSTTSAQPTGAPTRSGQLFADKCADPESMYDLTTYDDDAKYTICSCDGEDNVSCWLLGDNSQCSGSTIRSCSCTGANCFERIEQFVFDDGGNHLVLKGTCDFCLSTEDCSGGLDACAVVRFDPEGSEESCFFVQFLASGEQEACYACSTCTDANGLPGIQYSCFGRTSNGGCDTSEAYSIHPLFAETTTTARPNAPPSPTTRPSRSPTTQAPTSTPTSRPSEDNSVFRGVCDDPLSIYDLSYYDDDASNKACECDSDDKAIECWLLSGNSRFAGLSIEESWSCDGPNCVERMERFQFDAGAGQEMEEKRSCDMCLSTEDCSGVREICAVVRFAFDGIAESCSFVELLPGGLQDSCGVCAPCVDENGVPGIRYNCFDRSSGGTCDTSEGYGVHPLFREITAPPTFAPTSGPTSGPTVGPTSIPTSGPTPGPTAGPTSTPSSAPTAGPTSTPSAASNPTGRSVDGVVGGNPSPPTEESGPDVLIIAIAAAVGVVACIVFACLALWWCKRNRKDGNNGNTDDETDAATTIPPPHGPPNLIPVHDVMSVEKPPKGKKTTKIVKERDGKRITTHRTEEPLPDGRIKVTEHTEEESLSEE
eukprot:CAMPEP_0119554494 /NCGR_PEP_ID=MMETSP1352-20130426/6967_1 /TAXON_ID=265584 /ORGANISM="Stauroneis constricta, Strain CCMP1120" /LENGTH=1040 /DNA_ID=CAMNT_0007601095 /DNA_START=223 /DNA_END=3345 /DNA_ORIENTATION=+